jgi:glycerol uptake facilitator-like aquaporin
LAAEMMGTALLVAAVIGSGIMAERLAAGNAGVALLGNTLATAAMLFVLITVFGPVSGAHFNPAVTLILALRGSAAWKQAALFVPLQCLGGVMGALAAHAMFDLPLLQAAAQQRAGPGQMFSEGIATFALVLTILGFQRARPEWLPAGVAAAISAGYWFTSSTSFANPAVTIARSLTDSFSGIRSEDVLPFIGAQFAGALVASACDRRVLAKAGGPV